MNDQTATSFIMRDSMMLNSTNPSSLLSKTTQKSFCKESTTRSFPQAPSGFKQAPGKQRAQPMIGPLGDPGSTSSRIMGAGCSKMPLMQGHHEFNPKEVSTLLMADQSSSFFQQRKEDTNVTNNRLAELIFKQENFDSNFDESRLMETPVSQTP